MLSRLFNSFVDNLDQTLNLDMTAYMVRRIATMVLLSFLALIVLLVYGINDMLHGTFDMGLTAVIAGILLVLNVLHGLKYKNFQRNINISVVIVSLLLTNLYWSNDRQTLSYIWYLVYPNFVVFVLGSRRGSRAMALMLIPIVSAHFLAPHVGFITEYSYGFEFRFLGVYFVLCYQAILFENIVEKNYQEIRESHDSLEALVKERTVDLAQKVEQLDIEIAERTKAEQKISLALKEKDILLKEVHHRTKNNMQVITSLLNLQHMHIDKENINEAFLNLANRIRSMADVHERLYKSTDAATIDLGEYLKSLVGQLRTGLAPKGKDVTIQFKSDPVKIGLNQAVPLGLAVNEILSNSFQHGIPLGVPLMIRIGLQYSSGDQITLSISDNGPGLPAGFDIMSRKSLGTHLIQILVEDQLEGHLRLETTAGTSYHITFTLEQV